MPRTSAHIHANGSAADAGRGPATVFVADGDAAGREALARLVAPLGVTVRPFASGEALLEALAAGPLPAAAIVDMRLPDMTGLDFMARAAGRGLRVPTILLAHDPDVSTAVSAMRAGALDFLEQPGGDRRLLTHLARLLAPHSAGQ